MINTLKFDGKSEMDANHAIYAERYCDEYTPLGGNERLFCLIMK